MRQEARNPRTRDRARAVPPPLPGESRGLEHYVSRALFRAGPVAFGTLVLSVLAVAWYERNEGYLSADTGTGYWLGIAGATIMSLLLLYPLRKRYKFLQWSGKIAGWFRVHMILGILGPTLVILHTNFKLGSLNSQLALVTMLVVVASGIIGRYLYSNVHKGLYGAHTEMRDIAADLSVLKSSLGIELGGDTGFEKELERYLPADDASKSLLSGFFRALSARSRTSFSRRRVTNMARRHIDTSGKFSHWSRSQRRRHIKAVDGHLRLYFAAVRKAERLAFFERLFGLWHHLHVPLFILLALTVILHIVAVHRY